MRSMVSTSHQTDEPAGEARLPLRTSGTHYRKCTSRTPIDDDGEM
jgi:hypothetical protein